MTLDITSWILNLIYFANKNEYEHFYNSSIFEEVNLLKVDEQPLGIKIVMP